MVEDTSVDLRREGERLIEKLEVRMEKARREVEGMRRYQRLSPARRRRLHRYEKQLGEIRRLWVGDEWRNAVPLFRALDEGYPSVIGLVHGMSGRRKHREEVYEMRPDANSEVPYYPGGKEIAGAQAGFVAFGGGGGGCGGGGGGC